MNSVLVLNPNSSQSVSSALRTAIGPSPRRGILYEVDQIDEGPPEIQGLYDEAVVAPLVIKRVVDRQAEFDGFIIACHGDPGLLACRDVVRKPVVGIGEASLLAACAFGERIGLITLGQSLVAKKWRQIRACGLAERCVAIEPTDTGVLHGVEEGADFTPYAEAGLRAVEKGAQVLVLGCAGMVRARDYVERVTQVPVIEPVLAAVAVFESLQVASAQC